MATHNKAIPKADYALIGGSGTWGCRFPEDLARDDAKVVDVFEDGIETPYGRSTRIKVLKVSDKVVLRVAMHGRHYNEQGMPTEPNWVCSHQVAWVLGQAGVKWALVESSVGGIQSPEKPGEPLVPWSVVITDDTIMLWNTPVLSPAIGVKGKNCRAGEPFCSGLRKILYENAKKEPCFPAVYDHGVYVTTPWGRFETAAEVRLYAALGAHVAGQTLTHETSLMRKLGIHFGSLSIVSNYAEGTSDSWSGDSSTGMTDFYYKCAPIVGNVMINSLNDLINNGSTDCRCDKYYIEGHGAFPVMGA